MIPFTKMHGLGNDFVILDNRDGNLPPLKWAAIADRHFGIGCDQVLVLEPSSKADLFMRIYNADGGEVESCGNASRCVAWLTACERQADPGQALVRIETLAGLIEAKVTDQEHITVDMGSPHLDWRDIPLAQPADTLHLDIGIGELRDPVGVSMGNPHMVFFVKDANATDMTLYGPQLERHPLFPLRANVGVAQLISPFISPPPLRGRVREGGRPGAPFSPDYPPPRLAPAARREGKESEAAEILLRVWERGAGLTLACGTGACAALVAAHRRGLTGRKASVHLPGGRLEIEWREQDGHVLMTGPATVSFKGAFAGDGSTLK